MNVLGPRREVSLPQTSKETAQDYFFAEELARNLLAMLSRLPGVGDVLLQIEFGTEESGRSAYRLLRPVGRLPASGLSKAASEARRLGVPVVSGMMPDTSASEGATFLAVPFRDFHDADVTALLCAEIQLSSRESLSTALDILTLALEWVRLERMEEARDEAVARAALSTAALGAVVTFADLPRLSEALQALAIDLKERFSCDRVAIGLVTLRQIRVQAVSNAVQISRSQPLVRNLAAAMEEALDQDSPLLWPMTGNDNTQVFGAQAALAENDSCRTVFTVPMTIQDRQVGACVFERHDTRNFGQAELEIIEAVVSTLAPLVHEKRRNDQLLLVKALTSLNDLVKAVIGRRHFVWKVATLSIFFAILALATFEVPYTVKTDAVVQGAQQRLISANFGGFIAEAPVREGDQVQEGDLLARLDDREQTLELLRLGTLADEIQLEIERAIGEQKRSEAQILRARLDQIEAQRLLIDERIARMHMTSPFNAVVISGDLSRAVGRAVVQGDPLLTIAPTGDYRIRLTVDQSHVELVKPGLEGVMRLTASPNIEHRITLLETLPVARYGDGRTTFTVDAQFLNIPEEALHGMEGSARISIGRRTLAEAWLGPVWEQIRLWLWGMGLN